MDNIPSFTYEEARRLWARLVVGWARCLDDEGARAYFPGYPNHADVFGSYEGVMRMFWGIGSWLSWPERPSVIEWKGETVDLEAVLSRVLANGCNPASPSYWGLGHTSDSDYDQRTVETGQIAFALWQTRERVWDRLSVSEKENITAFLIRFGQRPAAWNSNWALFWMLNHASRKALGLPYDQALIDDVLFRYLDAVYCGDGWYDDASERGPGYFDDYNIWVFAMHVLVWAECDGASQPERRTVLLDRVRSLMQHYPYFFAADGAYCEFGRSLAYKFARLGAPLWAYKLGVWPHSVGMLKRLVGKHLRWYIDRGGVQPDGILRQPLTAGGSYEICEPYIATGSPYWAMQAFSGLWSLSNSDPFWDAEEESLPAEQENFKKIFSQPGWVVTAHEGQVQRFNAGSVAPHYGPKYSKFVYSTRSPFNVGLSGGFPSPDNMLCLTDGTALGQRTKVISFAVGEPGWLRIQYEQELHKLTHVIDTVIVVNGAYHLRLHHIRLNTASESLAIIEGSAALGYIQGQRPDIQIEQGRCTATIPGHCTGIKSLMGYDGQQIWQGMPGINSVYPYQIVPCLSLSQTEQDHKLACMVYDGTQAEDAFVDHESQVIWHPDGHVTIIWNELNLTI